MGSMNFGLFPMLDRYKEFKHEWERQHLEALARLHLPQHLQGHRAHHPGARRGLRHALRVRVLRRRPPLQPGAFPRPRAGQAAALRADDLRHPGRHRRRSGEPRCTCAGSPTSCSATATTGRSSPPAATRCRSCTMGATMGGNVRVGLEDIDLRRHAASSPRATPSRSAKHPHDPRGSVARGRDAGRGARSMLALKGGDQVAF